MAGLADTVSLASPADMINPPSQANTASLAVLSKRTPPDPPAAQAGLTPSASGSSARTPPAAA